MANNSLSTTFSFISQCLIEKLNFSRVLIHCFEPLAPYHFPENYISVTEQPDQDSLIISEIESSSQTLQLNKHSFSTFSPNNEPYVSTPLKSSTNQVLGHLVLFDKRHRTISDTEILSIESSARFIANSIENYLESIRLQEVFTDFMHKAIHDLKNPLTSISLTTELINKKSEDPRMVLNLSTKLEKATKKLISNLEKLKSAFPVKDSKFKLSINEVSLDELMTDIKHTLKNFNITPDNQITRKIHADYNRLKEAMIRLIGLIPYNLIHNPIHIKAQETESQIILSISLPSSYRIADENNSALTISKTLIEMHGGSLEVAADLFLCYLPV